MMSRWNPPLQGHNLGALHSDYFDLLAGLGLTVICSVFFTLCVLVGRQHLLARWPGSNLFDLLILGKSSSVLLFWLAVGLVILFVFCMIVSFGNGLCF